MICRLFRPQFVWVATGGKHGVKLDGIASEVLRGRKVFLFPDVDGLEDWRRMAKGLEAITGKPVIVIDIMNGQPAPEGKKKYDIADLLLDSQQQPYTAALEAFDKWFPLHRQGGIFEYEGRTFRITRNTDLLLTTTKIQSYAF